jgi:hypothetical protein
MTADVEMGGSSTMSTQAGLRVNLAVLHMIGAARFSQRVREIEIENAGHEFGDFWPEILHQSSACIFAAVASLEAYANDLFFDRKTVFPGFASPLLDKLWETFEQKRTLDKFEFALLLRDKQQLNNGASPYQDVAAVIELRNGLTHFKPEWDNEAVRHRKISERLQNRFTPSTFLNDELLFPRRWTTHGCTKWAVESCLSFAEEFERLAGLEPKYKRASANDQYAA